MNFFTRRPRNRRRVGPGSAQVPPGHVARLLTSITLLCTPALAGCSRQNNDRAEVSGNVLVDQVPLAEGSIAFFPIDGTIGPSAGAIVENGRYHIPQAKGAAVGRNRVDIRGFRWSGKKARDIWRPGETVDERVSAVGPEYNSQSTLSADIRAEKNELNFDLHGPQSK